jgi:biopolymer transport protein ExbD
MRVPTQRGRPIIEFDRTVTPMVDVVFQLLIFFVLASGGRTPEQSLSTSLAAEVVTSISAQPQKQAAEIWIRMKRDSETQRTLIELSGRQYADAALLQEPLQRMRAADAESVAILDVAADVPLGDVVHVYDVCRTAKLAAVNFAATPDELSRK